MPELTISISDEDLEDLSGRGDAAIVAGELLAELLHDDRLSEVDKEPSEHLIKQMMAFGGARTRADAIQMLQTSN